MPVVVDISLGFHDLEHRYFWRVCRRCNSLRILLAVSDDAISGTWGLNGADGYNCLGGSRGSSIDGFYPGSSGDNWRASRRGDRRPSGTRSAIGDLFAGCGQTCTEASNLANQAEAILTPMFNTYMASPIHYASMQQAFIASFNSTWSALEQACSNPSLGSAGTNCISQRAAGGCEWKVNAFGWNQINGQWVYTPAGANGSGSTFWNWFTGYLDPIQNDPTVVPDPVASSSTETAAGTSSLSIAGLSGSQLILPAALLLLLGVLFL